MMISDAKYTSTGIEKFILPDHSRIWIFQADRLLKDEEVVLLQKNGNDFSSVWKAHGKELATQFVVVDNLFAVMAIDERQESASGCSIDTFMRFILQAENQMECSFTNRMCFAFLSERGIELCKRNELKNCIATKRLTAESYVFDNLISTLGEYKTNRLKPAHQTWLAAAFN